MMCSVLLFQMYLRRRIWKKCISSEVSQLCLPTQHPEHVQDSFSCCSIQDACVQYGKVRVRGRNRDTVKDKDRGRHRVKDRERFKVKDGTTHPFLKGPHSFPCHTLP